MEVRGGEGIPLPASTQWELVRDGAEALAPVHEELVRQAAQGKVLYNDDTTAKILDLTSKQRAAAADDEETPSAPASSPPASSQPATASAWPSSRTMPSDN